MGWSWWLFALTLLGWGGWLTVKHGFLVLLSMFAQEFHPEGRVSEASQLETHRSGWRLLLGIGLVWLGIKVLISLMS
jgi:NADH:ubiquinone oxidoreductase subunit H